MIWLEKGRYDSGTRGDARLDRLLVVGRNGDGPDGMVLSQYQHVEAADDQRDGAEARQKPDVKKTEARAALRDHREIDGHHGEGDPGSDEVSLPRADDRQHHRAEECL